MTNDGTATLEHAAGDALATRDDAPPAVDMAPAAFGEPAEEQGPIEDPSATFIGAREEELNERLGDIRQKDDRFQHWTGHARRKHNRRHAIRLAVWAKQSLKRPEYIERKLASYGVIIASNSKTVERGIYGGAVRLGSSIAAREENGDPMLPHVVSRIAHTMAGISAFCQTHGLELEFGNEESIYQKIGGLSDQKLQELADAAALLVSAEDHLVGEGLVTPPTAPSEGKESCEVEQGGPAAASGDTPEETDTCGDAAIRREMGTGGARLSEAVGADTCGIADNDQSSAEETESLVRECLPFFRQLPKCSLTAEIPSEITLLVGLPANNDSCVLIYGPIESGSYAAKAVQIMMVKLQTSQQGMAHNFLRSAIHHER